MNNKITGTYLPLFPGFYNTIFEADEEGEIEHINYTREVGKLNEIGYDQMEFDYEEYNNKVAEECTNFIEEKLKELGMVTSIKFERVSSPKYYNFSNDSIHVEIEISPENRKVIMEYLRTHREAFAQHIKDHYTSCDGFISHYSNCIVDWLKLDSLEHEHKLGRIFDFVCENEEIEQMDMYDYCSDHDCHIYCSNYEEATELMYDFEEDEFVQKG